MKSQTASTRSSHRPSWTRIAAFVALIVFVALMFLPVFSSSMASSSSNIIRPKNALGPADQSSERIVERASKLESIWTFPGLAALAGTKSWFSALPSMTLAGETVELFASDCTTPKTAFSLGETVCAKTDGVDLTTPNNHYMNWIDSQLNQTNGGTITQNPQYFLFVPPTAGTWKATIGRVSPADSSIVGNPPLFTVSSTSAGISTFDSSCVTPKTDFALGQTVCATAYNGIVAPRRLVWIDPSGNARQVNDITADPQSFSFPIPATQTSVVGNDTVDNRGKWKVNMISSRGSAIATTIFVVKDPQNPAADVSIVKGGGGDISAGSSGNYILSVYNSGPDAATNVTVTDVLPSQTNFLALSQTGSPMFSCQTPTAGGPGTVTCTVANMPAEGRTSIQIAFQVAAGTAAGTVIANTATVSTQSTDNNSGNNSSTAYVTVTGGGGGGGTCTLTCPEDVNVQSNTTDPNNPNQPGAVVHYDAPTAEGTCGTLTFSHCNDCFFPEGITLVSVSEASGESCQFSVTVSASSNAPTITCPSNKVVDATGDCSAVVNVGTATATGGQNVTIFATRSDGRPMYNCDSNGQNCVRQNPDYPFGGGDTIITWTATSHNAAGDETGNASCTQTITVNNATEDTTAPVITCPGNITRGNDAGQCSAVINVGTATATDNCDSNPDVEGTRSDSLALSDPYPVGVTTITWTATDASGNSSSCQQTVTVSDTTAPAFTATAADSSAPGDVICQAPVPNYVASSAASDNCDSTVTLTQSPAAGTLVGAGPHTVTVTATDDAGNSSNDEVVFTVIDTTKPVFTATAADSSASADASCLAPVPNYVASSAANDNCDSSVTLTQSPTAGTMVGKGSHTVTVTATDDAGNQSTDTVVFTVNDTTAPVITCPANITRSNDPGMCSANVNPGTATATDNCDSPTISGTRSDNQPLNAPYPVGTTTITWGATDTSGNSSSCSQTITVNDTEAPTITCPANMTREATCPTGAVATYTAPTGSDNCPGATTTRTGGQASGTVFPIGTTTVTYTVNDAHGNSTSCSFTVTVLTPQAIIQNLKNSIMASSLTPTKKGGLIAKLDAALQAINTGQTNVACNKLSDFINTVGGMISRGDITAAEGNAWIKSANNVRNTIGCTNNPCT